MALAQLARQVRELVEQHGGGDPAVHYRIQAMTCGVLPGEDHRPLLFAIAALAGEAAQRLERGGPLSADAADYWRSFAERLGAALERLVHDRAEAEQIVSDCVTALYPPAIRN